MPYILPWHSIHATIHPEDDTSLKDQELIDYMYRLLGKVNALTDQERDVLFRHYFAQSSGKFDKERVAKWLVEKLIFDPRSPVRFKGEW